MKKDVREETASKIDDIMGGKTEELPIEPEAGLISLKEEAPVTPVEKKKFEEKKKKAEEKAEKKVETAKKQEQAVVKMKAIAKSPLGEKMAAGEELTPAEI